MSSPVISVPPSELRIRNRLDLGHRQPVALEAFYAHVCQ